MGQILQNYLASNLIMTDADASAIDYLGVDKRNLVQSIMIVKQGTRELYYDSDDATQMDDLQKAVLAYFNMHSYNWTKKYATITAQYEALQATAYNEIMTDANTGTDTHTLTSADTGTVGVNSTQTDGTADTTSKNTYDNDTMTETDAVQHTGTTGNVSTTTNDLHNAASDNLQHGHILTRNRSVTGRDNIPAQDLILKEREVAEYNFYEMIADELCDIICKMSYTFTEGVY